MLRRAITGITTFPGNKNRIEMLGSAARNEIWAVKCHLGIHLQDQTAHIVQRRKTPARLRSVRSFGDAYSHSSTLEGDPGEGLSPRNLSGTRAVPRV